MTKTILITGSSSGIGKLTAIHFANENWNVIATMRDPRKSGDLTNHPNIRIYPLDVTDTQTMLEAKDRIIKEAGQVDVVVNNAGFGVYGSLEEATESDIDRQLAVNVKGVMMMTKIWVPHFRENREGLFINISSMAGLVSYPLASLYIASKWAIEGFTESLYYELKPFNIKVKLVEPGGFKTNFQTTSITWTNDPDITAYDPYSKAIQGWRNDRQPNLPDPQAVAAMIFQAATDPTERLRYLVGADAEEGVAFRQKEGVEKFMERSYHWYRGLKKDV